MKNYSLVVSLMNEKRKKKVLVLVEGEKPDIKIMETLFHIYKIDTHYQLISYGTNIYVLYKEMFKDGNEEVIN